MAFGLEVYNAAGVKLVSLADRLGRFHATFAMANPGSGGSYFLSVPGFALDGTWLYLIPGLMGSTIRAVPSAGGFTVSRPTSGPAGLASYTLIVWRA